ncbi:MAG: aspartate aminotransferase family protein [Calditerrivibrio sp.]|nr:aspartate aminotransferase family protein [Calditerrivibrio sp.]
MNAVMNTYNRYDIAFIRGEGSYLYDKDGKRYVDFASGIAVTNLGHSNEKIASALYSQAKTLIHTSNLYKNPLQEEVAEVISKLSFGGKVFFCNSGAEANEAALKLARIYGNKKFGGKRYKVITMLNSFHGRTFATLSATGQDKVKKGFEPTLSHIFHIPFNDIGALKHAIDDETVAVMLEVIQGEGGVIPADRSYLKAVRDICSEKDILLIFDEVQTGIGRTGEVFGYQVYGVEPDIFTLAKALGNGFPVGAMVAKPQVAEYLSPGTHASTFGGNYLGCAIAKTVLEIVSDEVFLSTVRKKGEYLMEQLKKIVSDKAMVRGMGMMVGLRLDDGISMADFVIKANERGLLTVPAGDNTVRVYPALNIDYNVIDEGIEILEKIFREI